MTTFFKGYHVLIQARSEEDVKLDVIMTKVKDASGAKYGIHKETGPSGMDTASTSGAGSAYTPIQTNPGRLGSMSSPSSQTALPSPTVHQEKSSARPVFSSSPSTASIPQRFSQTAAKPPVLTSQTSSPTVSKPYIQHNSFSTANSPARPEFTRNTSFDRKEPDVVASPAASKWEQERLEIERMRREQDREREAEADAEQAAWRAKSRQEEEDKAKERERQDQLQRREEERREQERRAEMERKAASESEARRRQEQEAIELAQLQISQKTTVYEAIVLYDYAKDEDNEIDLVEGEIVTQVSEEEGGWYQGTNSKGQTGYFPGNYVELRQASESHASSQVAQPAAPAVQEEAPQSQISAVALVRICVFVPTYVFLSLYKTV